MATGTESVMQQSPQVVSTTTDTGNPADPTQTMTAHVARDAMRCCASHAGNPSGLQRKNCFCYHDRDPVCTAVLVLAVGALAVIVLDIVGVFG